MGRLLILVCIFGMLGTSFAQAHTHGRLAPADEYFGRQKMSILGIRNELRTVHGRVAGDPFAAESQLGSCRDVEDALEDFGSKYPQDTWLAGMIVDLESIYGHMRSSDARIHERALLAWVHAHFPRSALEYRMRLAMGPRFAHP